eukprot:CAMPEP_0174747778 /NCGR_PEP_ID=MMETSP1094-20130205/92068_1 /TAXON_ID=156173 /ORGANISM="Chrysochromulina brevifilum, Strain UTEX LB 985" /LENGTH=56 /DNA_ID=CAMNT_0015952721 /DNA_START=206 /DNA_END=373 /DNA_ORIENTATION=+
MGNGGKARANGWSDYIVEHGAQRKAPTCGTIRQVEADASRRVEDAATDSADGDEAG